jgi:rod shape-determining protein MreC
MQPRRSRPLILLLAVILGAFVIIILDNAGYLDPVNNALHSVFRPISITLTEARKTSADLLQTARDFRTLRQRNNELNLLVERLTVENLQLAEVVTENEQLRSFFEFAQTNPTYDFRGGQIIGRVISEGSSPFINTIEIDLGEKHGLKQGMPVVTDRGLVGRIMDVQPYTSEILLINDASSSVNAMTQTSRAPGALRGRVGQSPLMSLIPPDVEVSVGEIVITSGLGGRFPKGIVIGQIVDILQNDNQAFQQAVVHPTVDLDRLELVMVITSFPPTPEDVTPPTDEEAGQVQPNN